MGRHIQKDQFDMTKELMANIPIRPGESRKAYFDRLKKVNPAIPCKDNLYKIYDAKDYAEFVCKDKKIQDPDESTHDLAAAYRFLMHECTDVEMYNGHLKLTTEVSKWESLF